MRGVAILLIGASACGRIGFDAQATGDAAIDAPLGPFGPPSLIAPLASAADEEEATLSGDMLELVFRRRIVTDDDLFVSRRATTRDAWGAPVAISELNTASLEGAPALAADGLTLWFGSNRPGGAGNFDIWVTTRPDRATPWSPPVPVVEVNTTGQETKPAVSADGLVMWLTGSGPANEIKRSTRPTLTAQWTFPQAVPELDTSAADEGVQPYALNEIVFSSTRDDPKYDIYMARRASPSDPYTVIEPIMELNSASIDWDPWISADGHMIVFGSSRSGNQDLFEATR